MAFYPIWVSFVSFISTEVVIEWWKKLIFEREISRGGMTPSSRITASQASHHSLAENVGKRVGK